MKSFKKYISFSCMIAASACFNYATADNVIDSQKDINNSASYQLIRFSSSGIGILTYNEGSENVQTTTGGVLDDPLLWAIHYSEKEKNYYLYNLASKSFVKADSESNAVFTSEPVDVVLLKAESINRWVIDCGGALLGWDKSNLDKVLFMDDITATSATSLGCTFLIQEHTSRKISDQENLEIEEKIAAGRAGVLDTYREFVRKAEAVDADGLKNYAGTYDLTELKKALDAPDGYTLDEITSLYNVARLSALPKSNIYYRLRNFARPTASSMNNVLSLTDENVLRTRQLQQPAVGSASSSYAEDLAIFRIVKPENDPYAAKFEVSALGQWFGESQHSTRMSMVTADNAYSYTIERDDDFNRLFIFNDKPNKRWLTVSGYAELVGYAFAEDPEKWYLEEVKEIPVTTDANGYRALVLPCGINLPSSCKAYTVTGITDGKAYAKELTGHIPASVPFILKTLSGNSTVNIPVEYVEASVPTAMIGTNVKNVNAPARHEMISTPDGFYFHKVDASQAAPNSAYIIADTDADIPVVIGDDPGASIEEIPVEDLSADAILYDLQGRRVVNPVSGLYIDGVSKKVIRVVN